MNRSKPLLVAALLVVALATGATASAGRSAARAMVSETQLRALNHDVASAINAYRVAHGLKPLQISVGLNAASRQHSLEMGAAGYFDHNSKDGTAWWRRIQRYWTPTGYSHWTAGENLLWSAPSTTAAQAMKMWIGSPVHRRNLLNPTWRSLGVSAVHVIHAPGIYAGSDVTLITTDFGARS